MTPKSAETATKNPGLDIPTKTYIRKLKSKLSRIYISFALLLLERGTELN